MNLKNHLRPMLELESGSNDPMAYMLTIVLIQFIQSGGMGIAGIFGSFVMQFVAGAAAGYLLGKLAILMLNRLNIDNQALYPILLLSFIFFTFSITDLLKGNGYLAVYIAGIMVGNNKIMYRKEIYTFMDGLTWLFQIIMFLCLGLLVNPHELLNIVCQPSGQHIPLPAAFRKEDNPSFPIVHLLGRFARSGTYHLCHISGSGTSSGSGCHVQHRILYHDCLLDSSRNHRIFGCPPAEAFYSIRKNRE